jgi:hypothetical protein
MIRRSLNVLVPTLAAAALATLTLTAQQTGIANKRPVSAGACKVCPWGAVGEIVKGALDNYGYEVLICSSCAQSEGPRLQMHEVNCTVLGARCLVQGDARSFVDVSRRSIWHPVLKHLAAATRHLALGI